MQSASSFTPLPLAGQPVVLPGPPPSQEVPLQPGMWRGYEVSPGHPAWVPAPVPEAHADRKQGTRGLPDVAGSFGESRPLGERGPRAKRPASSMEDSTGPDAMPGPAPVKAKAERSADGTARPANRLCDPAAWNKPGEAEWEHPLDLEGADESPPEPVPVPLTHAQADGLLDRLGKTEDEARFLRQVRDELRRDGLARRSQMAPDDKLAISTRDHATVARALMRRWGGPHMSDVRLDHIAHELSSSAALTLKEDRNDLDDALFLRTVLTSVPEGSDTQFRWIRRILQEGFSKAHAGSLAYPLVGRGTLRMLLIALGHRHIRQSHLYFLLGNALVPRQDLKTGDSRLEWSGTDLQVTMAIVARVLCIGSPERVHPSLRAWLASARQFEADELLFLAAGLFASVPGKGEGALEPQALDSPHIDCSPHDSQVVREFLTSADLPGPRLAAAAFGLMFNLRFPGALMSGSVPLGSMDGLALRSLARAVARAALSTRDVAVAVRVCKSLMNWVGSSLWVPSSPEDRQAARAAKVDALGQFLFVIAPHCSLEQLDELVSDLRWRVYDGKPISARRAQKIASDLLPVASQDPVSSQEAQDLQQREDRRLAWRALLTAPAASS